MNFISDPIGIGRAYLRASDLAVIDQAVNNSSLRRVEFGNGPRPGIDGKKPKTEKCPRQKDKTPKRRII